MSSVYVTVTIFMEYAGFVRLRPTSNRTIVPTKIARSHFYTRTVTVATLVGWQLKKRIAVYTPFQFFLVDEKEVLYYTA